MIEITNVVLENEMDLILAHKQCMRLAELTGLSLPAQTTFATAVSEISRNITGKENGACIRLYISGKTERIKFITATLEDKRTNYDAAKDEGYKYATRLLPNIKVIATATGNIIELKYRLPTPLRIDDALVERLYDALNTDPTISPYEEIKRKNRQLIEMADKLKESEQQYKSLTDSLPIMIYTMLDDGKITYANQWLESYTGHSIAAINTSAWQHIIHPDDFKAVSDNWQQKSIKAETVIITEHRLREESSGEYRWHTGISIVMKDEDGNIKNWNSFLVDIHAQKMIAEALQHNKQLQEIQGQLEHKVKQLNQSNQQLEQFAYITSHDLQEPLRKISFYSDFLKKKHGHAIPAEAGQFFDNLINATERMKLLIQDVLAYSTVRRNDFDRVDLNDIAAETLQDLEISIKEKQAYITIGHMPVIEANARQLRQLFENLISNALKFATPGIRPEITVTAVTTDTEVILSFADNGIGFEQQYMDKMFDLFQKLHTRDKYTGTGIGLAICKKIAELHNGSIKAIGKPDEGAIFLINLPLVQVEMNDKQ